MLFTRLSNEYCTDEQLQQSLFRKSAVVSTCMYSSRYRKLSLQQYAL